MLGAFKKQSYRQQSGFTLIELMIVVAIIGILASVAIGAYQTYTVRAQVSEGIVLASNTKVPIVEAYQNDGEAPATRAAAGLSPNAADTQGSYVQSVEVSNGRVQVLFGNNANMSIANESLYLTPYETPNGTVVWRCGSAPVPTSGGGPLAPMGASGGGNTASFTASTIDEQFLPSSCRL